MFLPSLTTVFSQFRQKAMNRNQQNLPAGQAGSDGSAGQAGSSPGVESNKVIKIVVVDEDALIREMLFEYLRQQDYTVFLAANGKEALEQAYRERPDLMLLDVNPVRKSRNNGGENTHSLYNAIRELSNGVNMPVMDGLDVLKQLGEKSKHTKVIMMSGTETPEMVKSIKEPQVVDFLVKPFPLQKLKESIDRILR
jgi:DNA-binding NtrC family response regulator